jgi:hypothetical protein
MKVCLGVIVRLRADLEIVLDDSGKAALQTFFQSGGVYTGVHSASACLYDDTNYLQAVGGESGSLAYTVGLADGISR